MPYKNYEDHLENGRKYHFKHREKKNAYRREWYLKNKQRAYAGIRRAVHNNPELYISMARNYQYKKNYGIDLNEYNRMFQIQGGMCDICGIHQSQLKNRLSVDHNHVTGNVRGLLCWVCNRSVGFVEKWHRKVMPYLEKYEKENGREGHSERIIEAISTAGNNIETRRTHGR